MFAVIMYNIRTLPAIYGIFVSPIDENFQNEINHISLVLFNYLVINLNQLQEIVNVTGNALLSVYYVRLSQTSKFRTTLLNGV